MIRRPPSVIPLQQSDVDELEGFLAKKRAQAQQAAASSAKATGDAMDEDTGSSSKGKGKGKAQGGKGKGKSSAAGAADDSLIKDEQQARRTKEAMTRDQRIGV